MSKGPRIILVVVLILIAASAITMGLFNFLKKTQGITEGKPDQSITPHTEDWAPYLTTIDGNKVGSILVDLGLRDVAPISSKPNRLRVDVSMNHPDENGLPIQTEFQALNDIDEKLNSSLSTNVGATYAGHLYCQGVMSLYFFVGESTQLETLLATAMASYPTYRYKYNVDAEETWKTYTDFLYPLPIQLQSIHNQRVVAQIEREGDNLSIKRPVQHIIFFKTEADLERFLNSIQDMGYTVIGKEDVNEGDFKVQLLIERTDSVELKSVDKYVLDLWQKANDAGGEYDGWGSSIVKN